MQKIVSRVIAVVAITVLSWTGAISLMGSRPSANSIDLRTYIDTFSSIDSLVTADSLQVADSMRLDSLGVRDSLGAIDSLVSVDSLQTADSLTVTDSLITIDSLAGIDSLVALDSLTLDSLARADSIAREDSLNRKYNEKLRRRQIRDSIKAVKDSIRWAKPRVLYTSYIPDSVYYERIITWNAPSYENKFNRQQVDTTYNDWYSEYPYYWEDVDVVNLGTVGSATMNMDFHKRRNLDIFKPYAPYLVWSYTPETLPMYNTKTPYTELAYWGTLFTYKDKEELNIHFLHTQNITPELNFALMIDRWAAAGRLTNEATQNNNVHLSANYVGENYVANAGFIHQNISRQENGGVSDPSFVRDTVVDAKTIPVYLSNANNKLSRNTVFINHSYNVSLKRDRNRGMTDTTDVALPGDSLFMDTPADSLSFDRNRPVSDEFRGSADSANVLNPAAGEFQDPKSRGRGGRGDAAQGGRPQRSESRDTLSQGDKSQSQGLRGRGEKAQDIQGGRPQESESRDTLLRSGQTQESQVDRLKENQSQSSSNGRSQEAQSRDTLSRSGQPQDSQGGRPQGNQSQATQGGRPQDAQGGKPQGQGGSMTPPQGQGSSQMPPQGGGMQGMTPGMNPGGQQKGGNQKTLPPGEIDSVALAALKSLGEGPMLKFGHIGELSRYYRLYTDNIGTGNQQERDFYNNQFYINPQVSADSTRVRSIENKVYVSFQPVSRDAVLAQITGGVGHQWNSIYMFSPETFLAGNRNVHQNNMYVYATAGGKYRKYLDWNAMARYDFLGYTQNDLLIDGNIGVSFYPFADKSEPITLRGSFHTSLKEPDWFSQHYYSNHYVWENNFGKTSTTTIKANLEIPKWNMDAGFAYSLINNHLYNDTLGYVRQNEGLVNVMSAYLRKDFKLWLFHLDNRVLFQYSSDQNVLPLPMLTLHLRWYLQFTAVKNVLDIQIGADATFNTKYYAPAYNPALGTFQSQNDELIGNNPYIDVFVNLQWKRASIFLKVVNVGQGWPNHDTFSAYRYIKPVRTFKIGIHWPFYIK